ncbi:hypothetical protein [Pseudomonas sp. OF001]|nr:hypothetical protein [Pseudomonas sp. OF001]
MSRRQLRLQRAARRRMLGIIATTTAGAAWLCYSGLAGAITT